jgi:hypothetical protein
MLNDRGWTYELAPPLANARWVKRCTAGELVASQGDPVWHDDHHAIMAELGHG